MLYNLLREVKHRAAAAKAGQGAALLSFLKLGDGMFRRFNGWFARFMYGRYGSDQLNVVLLVLGLAISLAGSFSRLPWLAYLSWVPFFAVIFRMFSRNISARRRENQRFVGFFSRLRDRDNRYFSCPKCHQMVRVPKGKGKINIRCPKCGEKFMKKT